jgi:hypothetical protein
LAAEEFDDAGIARGGFDFVGARLGRSACGHVDSNLSSAKCTASD